MEQQSLFDCTARSPRARRRDPSTSHIAAARFAGSGAQHAHHARILAALRSRPGMTYTEIAEVTGLERHAVARRLKELEPECIRRGEPRAIGGNRPMTTWWPLSA